MPVYEYKCKRCGYRFEKYQKMSDPRETTCPECGGEVIRLISGGAGLIFKGSGFYITDYKKKPLPESKKEHLPQKSSKKDT